MSDQSTPTPTIFTCPTCGAPLTPPDDGYPSLQCTFCKNTVIVPPDLRRPARSAGQFASQSASQSAALKSAALKATLRADLLQLVTSGKKIEAIKRYREAFGVGLKEAKDAVEALELGRPVDLPDFVPGAQSQPPPEALADIARLARDGQVLEAIKLYRQRFNVGLKEAKDAVDALSGDTWQDVRQAAVSSQNALDQASELITITQLARAGNKLEAIKLYRQRFDVGLVEAKAAVESLAAGQPILERRTPTVITLTNLSSTSPQTQAAGKIAGCVTFLIVFSVVISLLVGVGAFFFAGNQLGGLGDIVEVVRPTPILSGPAILIPAAGSSEQATDILSMTYHPDNDTRTLARVSAAENKILWETSPLDKDVSYLDVLIADLQHVYTIREDRLLVYNLEDGRQAWQTTLADRLGYCGQLRCVLSLGGRLLVLTTDGTLQAYDSQSGAPVWNRRSPNAPRGMLPVGRQVAFIEGDANNDYAMILLDPANGEEALHIAPQCHTGSWDESLSMDSPMIYDGKDSLYFVYGWHPGCVEKWHLQAGSAELVWQTLSEDGYFGASDITPLLTENTLYFQDQEVLRAVDLQSGEVRLLAQEEDFELLPLVASGDLLVVRARRTRGSERFELWGVDPASGERRWQISLSDAGAIDPPDDMAGLVSDRDAWTWGWFTEGAAAQLVIIKAQAAPNQLVVETYDGASGTLQKTASVPLQWFSSDFYTIPELLGWRGHVLWMSVSPDIYALDVDQGTLIFGGH